MEPTYYSLIPPIITLALAFATRHIVASLGAGIIVAGLITTQGNVAAALHLIGSRMLATTELMNLKSLTAFMHSEKLLIFAFLICLGIVITLIGHAGGAHAYGNFFRRRLTDKRSAESSCLFLSSLLFIDDYFSSLTVGSVMQPLTDQFKIARVKLAFLVDSMGAPLCAFSPISSWGAAIVMQLALAGISSSTSDNPLILADPFAVYLQMIPFNFHTIFIIVATWWIVRRSISFGLMGEHEKVARETGNLFNGKAPLDQRVRQAHEDNIDRASLVDFVVPIVTLFVAVVISMLYTGGYHHFGGTNSLFATFNEAKSSLSLFIGSAFSLVVTLVLFMSRGKVRVRELFPISKEGFELMFGAIKLLVFAWTLSSFLQHNLQTGAYIAHLLPETVSPAFLPPLFMLCGAFIAFAIGSAWGTMAILFPIAIPMLTSMLHLVTPVAADQVTLLFPTLAAILSGALLGDHISPIADITIMASASAGAYHIDYIYAQFGYALPVAFGSLIAFITAGYMCSYGALVASLSGLAIGLTIALGILELLNRLKK